MSLLALTFSFVAGGRCDVGGGALRSVIFLRKEVVMCVITMFEAEKALLGVALLFDLYAYLFSFASGLNEDSTQSLFSVHSSWFCFGAVLHSVGSLFFSFFVFLLTIFRLCFDCAP